MRLRKFTTISALALFLSCLVNLGHTEKEPTRHLYSVLIHLSSKAQLKQLKKYPLEIVRIQPTSSSNSPSTLPSGDQTVEAIASTDVIKRLVQAGFSITTLPEKPILKK